MVWPSDISWRATAEPRSSFLQSYGPLARTSPSFGVQWIWSLIVLMNAQYIKPDSSANHTRYNCPGTVSVEGLWFLWVDTAICYLHDRKHRHHTSQVSFWLPLMCQHRLQSLCYSRSVWAVFLLVHVLLVLAGGLYPKGLRASVAFLLWLWHRQISLRISVLVGTVVVAGHWAFAGIATECADIEGQRNFCLNNAPASVQDVSAGCG